MCGGPAWRITGKEAAFLCVGAVILSPVLLTGAAIYGAGVVTSSAVRRAKRKAHARSVRRFWRQLGESGTKSPLQQLWDRARETSASPDRWRLGLALLAVGDLRAAHKQFQAAYDQEQYNSATAIPSMYYMGLGDLQLHRWQEAYSHLRMSGAYFPTPEQAKDELSFQERLRIAAENGVSRSVVKGLEAFALLQLSTRGGDRFDFEGIQGALEAAEAAAEMDPSDARHPLVAAWALFFLGLRATDDGKAVTVDEAVLRRALSAAQRAKDLAAAAERDTQAAIIAEFGDRAKAALASEVAQTGGVVDGTVVPKVLEEVAFGGADSDDDDATAEPLEAHMTGQGASGLSIAEVLSLEAQIRLALGEAAEAATALAAARALDPEVLHSGLSTDDGVTDPRVGLLAPWPLPAGAAGAAAEDPHSHQFAETALFKPTWCDQCMRFIGIPKCLRCKNCGYNVHLPSRDGQCAAAAEKQPCIRATVTNAAADAKSAVATQHQHVLRHRRVHSTHDCIQCGKFIMFMARALECNVCRQFVHLQCAGAMSDAVVDRPAKDDDRY